MPEHDQSTLSILFVEDEPDIRTIVEIALGLDPTVAMSSYVSAEEALAALDQRSPPFDVALLNMRLPMLSGLELMRRLHARPEYHFLPIIFITSSVREADIDAYHRAGARGTIEKPFDPLTLVDRLRAMIS